MTKKTKDKILDVAEKQFSVQGFDTTSLRSITAEAEVNLASVNYHFGSKKSLIQAVLERYLSALMPDVDSTLAKLQAEHQSYDAEQVLTCLAEPLLNLQKIQPNGTATFLRLIARGYIESQGHLRRFIVENYGSTLENFMQAIYKSLPELSSVEVFWRLHFALGTMVFAASSEDALTDIAEADFGEQGSVKRTIARIIRFISAGLSAPEIETQG